MIGSARWRWHRGGSHPAVPPVLNFRSVDQGRRPHLQGRHRHPSVEEAFTVAAATAAGRLLNRCRRWLLLVVVVVRRRPRRRLRGRQRPREQRRRRRECARAAVAVRARRLTSEKGLPHGSGQYGASELHLLRALPSRATPSAMSRRDLMKAAAIPTLVLVERGFVLKVNSQKSRNSLCSPSTRPPPYADRAPSVPSAEPA